ncbi:3'-5' exonuclease [Bacillus gobiensis]|uniref:3'-5' exonuclease n=1 Tax=Bacillus gobiensis TaxID=1441095 RepID=UPI003D1FCEF4
MDLKTVAIDFETANAARDSACSIGVVVYEEKEVVLEKEWYIRPKNNWFHSINTSIHGINASMVEHKPTFDELWPEIRPLLENSFVIAHNASFDFSVLRKTLDTYNLEYPELEYSCTMQMARRFWTDLYNHRLSTIAEILEFSFQHHNALEDAKAAMLIFQHISKTISAVNHDEVLNHLSLKKGLLYAGGYKSSSAPKTTKRLKPRSQTNYRLF